MKRAVFVTEFVASYKVFQRPGPSQIARIPRLVSNCGESDGVTGTTHPMQRLFQIDQLAQLRIFFLRFVTFRS